LPGLPGDVSTREKQRRMRRLVSHKLLLILPYTHLARQADPRRRRDKYADAVPLALEGSGRDLADGPASHHISVPNPLVPVGVFICHRRIDFVLFVLEGQRMEHQLDVGVDAAAVPLFLCILQPREVVGDRRVRREERKLAVKPIKGGGLVYI
jgi:hypothetical protein